MKEAKAGISRRTFAKAAVAGAAVTAMGVAAAGCGGSSNTSNNTNTNANANTNSNSSSSSTKTPCTIGYWGGSPCELPVYVAIENKYFEEAGLEPNIIKITSDTSILLANNEIDCFMSTPGDFPALYQGMNLKLIDHIHVGCWSGVTNNSEIKSCKDLSGKKVGTTMLNGPAYTECMALCGREGGDPSKIEWIKYSGSTIAEALKNHEIDAACGSDATTYPIRYNDQENIKFFYTSAQALGEYYCCFIGVNSNSLEKTPEMGDKLAVAFAKASDKIQEDPKAAIDMSMEKGYASNSYPAIQEGLTVNYMFDHGNKSDFEASIKERWKEMNAAGLLTEKPSDESKLDSYLDSLVAMVGDFRGDVAGAKETADTEGAAAHLKKITVYTI